MVRGQTGTSLPPESIRRRCAREATFGSWVFISRVRPASWRRPKKSRISAPEAASRLPVGSSARTTAGSVTSARARSEEHTSELQSRRDLVCRLLLEKKNKNYEKNNK